MNNLVTPNDVRAAHLTDNAWTVIDVRGGDEFAAGHFPGALHIPGDQLQERLNEIPRGRPVVTY